MRTDGVFVNIGAGYAPLPMGADPRWYETTITTVSNLPLNYLPTDFEGHWLQGGIRTAFVYSRLDGMAYVAVPTPTPDGRTVIQVFRGSVTSPGTGLTDGSMSAAHPTFGPMPMYSPVTNPLSFQFFPALALHETGAVGLAWYDSSGSSQYVSCWGAGSLDGLNWSDAAELCTPFSPIRTAKDPDRALVSIADRVEKNALWDYIGLAAIPSSSAFSAGRTTFVAAWTDHLNYPGFSAQIGTRRFALVRP